MNDHSICWRWRSHGWLVTFRLQYVMTCRHRAIACGLHAPRQIVRGWPGRGGGDSGVAVIYRDSVAVQPHPVANELHASTCELLVVRIGRNIHFVPCTRCYPSATVAQQRVVFFRRAVENIIATLAIASAMTTSWYVVTLAVLSINDYVQSVLDSCGHRHAVGQQADSWRQPAGRTCVRQPLSHRRRGHRWRWPHFRSPPNFRQAFARCVVSWMSSVHITDRHGSVQVRAAAVGSIHEPSYD